MIRRILRRLAVRSARRQRPRLSLRAKADRLLGNVERNRLQVEALTLALRRKRLATSASIEALQDLAAMRKDLEGLARNGRRLLEHAAPEGHR